MSDYEQETRYGHSSEETPQVQDAFSTPDDELYREVSEDYEQTMKDVRHRPPERDLAESEDPDYHVSL